MRQVTVFFRDEEAGILTQHADGSFAFTYHRQWLEHPNKVGICLAMPADRESYHSPHLFPFFFNMLPEGANRQLICRQLRIDERDYFGLLMAAAAHDTIGAVTVRKS